MFPRRHSDTEAEGGTRTAESHQSGMETAQSASQNKRRAEPDTSLDDEGGAETKRTRTESGDSSTSIRSQSHQRNPIDVSFSSSRRWIEKVSL